MDDHWLVHHSSSGPGNSRFRVAATEVVLLPFARPVFEVSVHPAGNWPLVFALALAPVTVVEVGKLVIAAWKQFRQKISP